jgi:hypothetical protein
MTKLDTSKQVYIVRTNVEWPFGEEGCRSVIGEGPDFLTNDERILDGHFQMGPEQFDSYESQEQYDDDLREAHVFAADGEFVTDKSGVRWYYDNGIGWANQYGARGYRRINEETDELGPISENAETEVA